MTTETASAARDVADDLADAVRACGSVSGLAGGLVGEVATYLPGRRVTGVALRPAEIIVSVVARWQPLTGVVDEVRGAAGPFAAGRPVTVRIDGIDDPPAPPSEGDTP